VQNALKTIRVIFYRNYLIQGGEMTADNFFLMLLVIAVLLPILPAFILFKYVKSDGQFSGPLAVFTDKLDPNLHVKFAGAFAGYFAVFFVLMGALNWHNKDNKPYELWTIKGKVLIGRDGREPGENSKIIAITLPPRPEVKTDGSFLITDVPLYKDGSSEPSLHMQLGDRYETVQLGNDKLFPGHHKLEIVGTKINILTTVTLLRENERNENGGTPYANY
jgi:hypothetical protein